MDAEECEEYTDVFWIKFCLVNNARFAKKKLDEHVFFGNRLQVSYAPQFESLSDTKDKLEGRRREVLARLNPGISKRPKTQNHIHSGEPLLHGTSSETNNYATPTVNPRERDLKVSTNNSYHQDSSPSMLVTSDEAYFPSQSMNQTVQLVREKLHKIQSSADHLEAGLSKKPRFRRFSVCTIEKSFFDLQRNALDKAPVRDFCDRTQSAGKLKSRCHSAKHGIQLLQHCKKSRSS
uniref:RNA-binding protein 48 n=1 Tax=Daucus carota subsp. sativus TaxID=79200 RepID=A0A175YQX7_DAUCS